MINKYNFDFSAKTRPFSHQVEAINYIQSHQSVALFDEQGLGKTKIVIEAICNNLQEGLIDGCLVICRKTLIQNWRDEIETHTYLKSITLRGSPKEKGINFMGYANFYLINYESVIGELERLKMFLKIRKFAIVLDESHAIKNPDAATTKAVLGLSPLSIKRIIISGTPVANKPEDLWSQYNFLDNGNLLGKVYSEFKSTYAVNLKDPLLLNSNKNLIRLREIIAANSIRRKKNDVLELPEKKYINEYVFLKGKQLSMYLQLKNELFIEIQNLEGDIVLDRSEDLLKKLLRLAQIASNPKLIDQAYTEEPTKFPVLNNLVEDIITKDQKVIIWSCFVDNIKILNKKFQPYGSQMIHGEIPIDRRNLIVKRFRNDSNYKVLVANPAAAKEGLTLTSANNAIYVDRNFNLVDYLQSQDRIHRISQTKECNIIKLIAKNTIDEYMDQILLQKESLAGYIQGDHNSINLKNNYSKEELLEFIGGKQ